MVTYTDENSDIMSSSAQAAVDMLNSGEVNFDIISADGSSALASRFVEVNSIFEVGSRCLIPRFDGVILSLEWKEALWDKFVMAAPRPRTRLEQQYSDRKLRSRS